MLSIPRGFLDPELFNPGVLKLRTRICMMYPLATTAGQHVHTQCLGRQYRVWLSGILI